MQKSNLHPKIQRTLVTFCDPKYFELMNLIHYCRINRTHQNDHSEAATHCGISSSGRICLPSVTMRTAYWSPCGLTSATLPGTPLQHRTVTERLWMCALVRLLRKLLICWGFFDTTRDGVWKKQEKTSSESQFWVQVSLMPVLCPTMNNLKVVSWTWHIGSLYNILSSTQYSTIWVSWNRRLRSWMLQPIKCIYRFVLVVVFTFDSSLGWQSRMSKRILHSCLTTVPLRHDLGWIINT